MLIAIANQKGGVGKTTTTVNLATSFAVMKRKVLVIDMDPQGNASTGFGLDKHDPNYSLSDVILGSASVEETIQTVESCAVNVLVGGPDLTIAEIELMGKQNREFYLKKLLQPIMADYDYILIDCPPSLNMLTVNALVAADGLLIPMQCEYYALEGLSALMNTITRLQEHSNPKLTIIGLLRTMYDPRSNLARDVSNQLLEHFGDQVYETTIPRNIRLAEAPSHGLPVLNYDQKSRGALAYLALAAEVISKKPR